MMARSVTPVPGRNPSDAGCTSNTTSVADGNERVERVGFCPIGGPTHLANHR